MRDTISDLFDSIIGEGGDFFIPPFMTVKTALSYPMRFGWYHRRSLRQHEFWWGGTSPLVTVTDEYAMTMPQEIVQEIGHALNAKGEGAYLD